jgi:hypothetical protein
VSRSPDHDPEDQNPMDEMPAQHNLSADSAHVRTAAELPTHALGDPLDAPLEQHLHACPQCQEDLAAYRSIVRLAHDDVAGAPSTGGPSPQVWTRVVDELGLSAPRAEPEPDDLAAARTGRGRTRRPAATAQPGRTRRVVAGLLVAAAIVAAGVVGWVIGDSRTGSPGSTAQAQLAAQPGTAASAHGHADMRASGDGYQMQLTTSGLPAPAGYYEVWLYDPSANKMVAIGTLGTDARGTFTVPAGIDTRAYHIVDVSDQRYNGNAAHQTSVLRGALTNS